MGTKATQTFYNLVVNNTGAGTSLTYGGSCTTVTVNTKLTMTSGIFNVSTNTLSGAGKFLLQGVTCR